MLVLDFPASFARCGHRLGSGQRTVVTRCVPPAGLAHETSPATPSNFPFDWLEWRPASRHLWRDVLKTESPTMEGSLVPGRDPLEESCLLMRDVYFRCDLSK